MKKIIQSTITNDYVKPASINIRLSWQLAAEINNHLQARKQSNDFTYLHLSDFIRKALQAYHNGMELQYPTIITPHKKAFSLTVEPAIEQFYQSWPIHNRWSILEACVNTLY